MNIVRVTPWGEEHGLIATYPNSVPDEDFKNADPKIKEKLKKEKKEDSKVVKVRYINHDEQERGRLRQPYCKYAGEPIQMWNLIHGEEYELPLGFARQINELRTPVREGLQSVDGKNVQHDGTPIARDKMKRTHEVVSTADF